MQRALLSIMFVLLAVSTSWSEKVPIYTEGGVIWVEQDGGLSGATTTDILQNEAIGLNTAKRTYPEADETKVANVPADTNAALAGKVGTTGNETIGGIKTFTSPPIVPTPTSEGDVANKGYVDSMTVGTAETAQNSLLLEGQPASAFAPALGIDDNYVTGVEKAALPFMTLKNVENYFTATQYFQAGAQVSLAAANFADLIDFKIGGVQAINDMASPTSQLTLMSTKGVHDLVNGAKDELRGEIVTSSSGYVIFTEAPYSDVACSEGSWGVWDSVEYKCHGGFWSLQVALSPYVNTGGAPPPPPVGEISHYLDFNSDATTDLAGGFTLVQPAGTATVDSTAYGVLEGSQSALLRNNASGVNELLSPVFDPQESVYYAYQFQAQTTASSWIHGAALKTAGTIVGYIGKDGNYKAYHGTVSATILASPLANTTYYVCGKYTNGTGANGYHAVNIGINADPSLNATTIINTGDGVGAIDQWSIAQYSSNHILFDTHPALGTPMFQNSPITACSGAGL